MTKATNAKFVDVPGGKLAYESAGKGPAVVLLHEAIADRRVWDREFALLAKNHHVVRYDLRGYGESAPAVAPFSSVQDLRILMDHLHIPRAVVVGPSMGGRLAVDFAVEFPTRVSGLVLVAPGPPSGIEVEMLPEAAAAFEADAKDSNAIAAAWSGGDVDRAIELVRLLWCPVLEGADLDRFRAMVRENAEEALGDRSARHDQGGSHAAVPRLSALTVPVEILLGDRDAPLQRYFVDFLAKRIPGAHVEVVPGGDHLLNVSRPQAFDAALARFLERVEVGT